jgi:molybdopterin-containing oxidoreductase family iron-sulfur binding subunit
MMGSSRRSFIKITGLSALGLSSLPIFKALASSGGDGKPAAEMLANEKAITAKRWGMVVDTRKIKGHKDIEPLIQACHSFHNVPTFENKNHEIKWLWETEYKHAFPSRSHEYVNERTEHLPFPVLCNHCENPPCVRACPTKATWKREEDGVVLMDMHRCIGCRFCMAACPFGARSFNFRDPRPFIAKINKTYPTRTKGVVEKCNFCAERLAVGKMPLCVEASNGILAFGDLEDPNSEVRKLLSENYTIRRKQSLGTGPSVYYIV